MRIKTSELTGAALDWAVAKAAGYEVVLADYGTLVPWTRKLWPALKVGRLVKAKFSTDWSQGGPIIDREGISITDPHDDRFHPGQWAAYKRMIGTETRGPTPLIAAMRCFVASKLGDEVDVPQELLT